MAPNAQAQAQSREADPCVGFPLDYAVTGDMRFDGTHSLQPHESGKPRVWLSCRGRLCAEDVGGGNIRWVLSQTGEGEQPETSSRPVRQSAAPHEAAWPAGISVQPRRHTRGKVPPQNTVSAVRWATTPPNEDRIRLVCNYKFNALRPQAYAVLLNAARGFGQLTGIIFASVRSPNSFHYSAMVSGCDGPAAARAIFLEARNSGHAEVGVYNALASVLSRLGDREGAQAARQLMQADAVEGNSHTFSSSIAQARDLGRAMQLFEEAKKAGCASISVYTALEAAQRRYGDAAGARQTREDLKGLQAAPSAYTCSARIAAARNMDEVQGALRDAQKAGVDNISVYCALEAQQRRMGGAAAGLGQLQDPSGGPLISAHACCSRIASCTSLDDAWRVAVQAHEHGCDTISVYNALLSAQRRFPPTVHSSASGGFRNFVAKQGQAESAAEVMKGFQEAIAASNDDDRVYIVTVALLRRLGDERGAHRVHHMLQRWQRRLVPGQTFDPERTRRIVTGICEAAQQGEIWDILWRHVGREAVVAYVCNHSGVITDVDTPGPWDQFAEKNTSRSRRSRGEVLRAGDVVGKSLYSFMSPFYAEFYTAVLAKMEQDPAIPMAAFTYFCDGPDVRRQNLMVMRRYSPTTVSFTSVTVAKCAQSVPFMGSLSEDPQGQPMCGWCNALQTPDGKWASPCSHSLLAHGSGKCPTSLEVKYSACDCCVRALLLTPVVGDAISTAHLGQLYAAPNASPEGVVVFIDGDQGILKRLGALASEAGWHVIAVLSEDAWGFIAHLTVNPAFIDAACISDPRIAKAVAKVMDKQRVGLVGIVTPESSEAMEELRPLCSGFVNPKMTRGALRRVLQRASQNEVGSPGSGSTSSGSGSGHVSSGSGSGSGHVSNGSGSGSGSGSGHVSSGSGSGSGTGILSTGSCIFPSSVDTIVSPFSAESSAPLSSTPTVLTATAAPLAATAVHPLALSTPQSPPLRQGPGQLSMPQTFIPLHQPFGQQLLPQHTYLPTMQQQMALPAPSVVPMHGQPRPVYPVKMPMVSPTVTPHQFFVPVPAAPMMQAYNMFNGF